MPVKYSNLLTALEYVSATREHENKALICKQTGKTFWSSAVDYSFDQWPDDAADPDKYVIMPSKHELDLGRGLVRAFVAIHAPQEWETIEKIFSKRGAYRRYKQWLVERHLLEARQKFEEQQTKTALAQWCEREGIELIDDSVSHLSTRERPSD